MASSDQKIVFLGLNAQDSCMIRVGGSDAIVDPSNLGASFRIDPLYYSNVQRYLEKEHVRSKSEPDPQKRKTLIANNFHNVLQFIKDENIAYIGGKMQLQSMNYQNIRVGYDLTALKKFQTGFTQAVQNAMDNSDYVSPVESVCASDLSEIIVQIGALKRAQSQALNQRQIQTLIRSEVSKIIEKKLSVERHSMGIAILQAIDRKVGEVIDVKLSKANRNGGMASSVPLPKEPSNMSMDAEI